jgi:hypothetical protein
MSQLRRTTDQNKNVKFPEHLQIDLNVLHMWKDMPKVLYSTTILVLRMGIGKDIDS